MEHLEKERIRLEISFIVIQSVLTSQMLQLAEFHAKAIVSAKPKRPSSKARKQKLLTFLQGTF
jgi:hypothetical protein